MPRDFKFGDVKCHNKLILKDRVRVIKAYKKCSSYVKVANQFKCSARQIRNIVKRDKHKILSEYVNSEDYIDRQYALCEKTLQFRIWVLKAYSKNPSYIKLANQFTCSVLEIQNITNRGKQKTLEDFVNTINYLDTKYAEHTNTVNTHVVILLEKVLFEWFQRAQTHIETGAITNEILLQKTEEAKKILGMPYFTTDLEWLQQFRTKYDITDLDMTMLRIGDDDPLILDMSEIIMDVVDQNPVSTNLPHCESGSLSELNDSDLDFNSNISEQLEQANDGSMKTQETDEAGAVELIMPPISNDEQARRHLQPLEDYVLLKENFRAIGLIAQLEEIFTSTNSN